MAKVKKKENLTPEERLQVALVPENEQPYKVPGNWCWVKFGAIIELISGRDAKSTDYNSLGRGIPYILGASNLENNVFKIERWIENPQVISLKNDILLSVKGTIGKVYLQKEERINISRQIMSIRTGPSLIPQFTYWFVSNISDSLREVGNGLIPGISREDILQKEVPLPPISEQQRIVDRIESLFAKLDEAKQKAQDAQDSFETRKAAILHKAFTGELTAQWRKEHGVGMESWENKTLQQLSQKIGDGLHGTPVYSENGAYFFINGNNFSGLKIEIKPDTKRVDYSQYQKYKIELGDNTVLVSINGTLGKTALYKNELVVLGKSACYINVGEKLNKFFLRYFLESTEFLNYADKMATGSTIKNLGLKAMRNLMLKLPSVPEQTEIVRLLDDLIAKEQRAKEAAERVLGQIDLIKKAILARAFRGELGTNAPNEESAVELLKQVL